MCYNTRIIDSEVNDMDAPKGTLEVTIDLNKNTCYFMKTGKCSLNVVEDFTCSSGKIGTSDLLYCPKLYKTMKSKKENMRPVSVAICECGHAEVISGHQRACIAGQRGISIPIRATEEEMRPACAICGGQMTFDAADSGARIVTVNAIAILDNEPEAE